jgi:hypothetical protein
MPAIVYSSIRVYIQSASELCDKIARLDQVIDALLLAAVGAAENSDVESYVLNDGQSTIQTNYRTPEDIAEAIEKFELIRQRYVNRFNGRIVRLVDMRASRGYRNNIH